MPWTKPPADNTVTVDFRIEEAGPIDPSRFRPTRPDPQIYTACNCFHDWWVSNPDKHFEGPADIRVVYTWYGPKNDELRYDVFRWVPEKY